MAIGFLDGTSTRIVPDKDFIKYVKPVYNLTSHGEGYESRISLGTNTTAEVYDVSFKNRPVLEIERIVSFFNEREKYKNFEFTVPDEGGEKTILVYCESYDRVYLTETEGSITAKFTQVFENEFDVATVTITTGDLTVNEGTINTINVTTTQRAAEILYWSLDGATTSDFTAVNGSFSLTGSLLSASGTFDIEVLADVATEGTETYTLSVREGSVGGLALTTSQITILDTSVAPEVFQWVDDQGDPVGSENITSGQSLTVYVGVSNFDPTENIYFSVDPIASSSLLVNPSFGVIDLSGNFVSSSASQVLQSILDVEQSTPKTLNLRKDSISGQIVDTITLNFLPETFIGGRITNALQQDIDFVLLELGSPFTTTINYTANFFDIQTIYWTIENATGGVDFDLVAGSFTPTGTNDLNTGTFDVVKQSGTETEAFIINLRTGSAVGPIIDSCVLVYGSLFVSQTEELDSLNSFGLAKDGQIGDLVRYTIIPQPIQETESVNNTNTFSSVEAGALSGLVRQVNSVVSKTESISSNNSFGFAQDGQFEVTRVEIIVGAQETESINNTNTFSSESYYGAISITRT